MTGMHPNSDAEVNISEKGILVPFVESITPGGSGTQSSTFTVPTGKKWIFKAVSMFGSSLSASVTYVLVRAIIDSENIDLTRDDSNDNLYEQYGNHNLTLKAGDSIRLIHQLGSYTSGSIVHSILVQEYDES